MLELDSLAFIETECFERHTVEDIALVRRDSEAVGVSDFVRATREPSHDATEGKLYE